MNNQLAKDLQSTFTKKGYNPVIGTIYDMQEYWLSWYRGNVDGVHIQQKKNIEGTVIPIYKPSLQMAKKVAEDVTSLLFNEKVQLIASGSETAQDVLDSVLLDNNFTFEMTNFLELTAGAYGTGVIVEYLSNGETKLNYLFGDKVVVIDYDNTTIKSIAVVQQFNRDKKRYSHVMYHTFQDGVYRIEHEMYSIGKDAQGLGKPDALEVLFNEKELRKMRHTEQIGDMVEVKYYVEYKTDQPHFQVFKFPIANNFDVQSPMGIPVIANGTSTLENIDEKYYSSKMDSVNSRKRIFVDQEATKLVKVSDGTTVSYKKYFDPDETQFQPLKDMGTGGKFVDIYAPVYDSAQHDNAIQAELNYLSDKCMLGPNYYSYKDGVVGYQNELSLSLSNAPMRRKRNLTLVRLKGVLIGLMKSILYLEQQEGRYTGSLDLEYDVLFDDDIFTDDKSKLEQLRLDVQDGFAPEYMYVMQAYGLSEEEAKAQLLEASGYGQENDDGVDIDENDEVSDDEDQVEE